MSSVAQAKHAGVLKRCGWVCTNCVRCGKVCACRMHSMLRASGGEVGCGLGIGGGVGSRAQETIFLYSSREVGLPAGESRVGAVKMAAR